MVPGNGSCTRPPRGKKNDVNGLTVTQTEARWAQGGHRLGAALITRYGQRQRQRLILCDPFTEGNHPTIYIQVCGHVSSTAGRNRFLEAFGVTATDSVNMGSIRRIRI